MHEFSVGGGEETWVVIAHSVRTDGSENIEELVTISVNNDVSQTFSEVDWEVSGKSACGISQITLVSECLGGGEAGLN